nr:D-TA family PLP-dependent enzyme [Allomuricauda sp.]
MIDPWFRIENIDIVDSPSIVLYKQQLQFNIGHMVSLVDGQTERLMPHVKTNKMPEVMKLLLGANISNFKASTVSEAEIAAGVGAKSVLVAHQLVGPKVTRFLDLNIHFPETKFSTILDSIETAKVLNEASTKKGINAHVYIDVNNGMNRSGIEVGQQLLELAAFISTCASLSFMGLHVYDGHLRDSNFGERNQKIESGLEDVTKIFEELKQDHPSLQMICGGTPSFTSHLLDQGRITSPGTCVLWDWGYSEKLQEQDFKFAALVVTRIISKPTKGIITVDMGHKSIAPENPIDKRVKFLNLDHYELLSQSEEHGLIKVQNWDELQIGDVLYGIPYHICPTINLHDEVSVIDGGQKVDTWEITARRRKLRF